MRILKIRRLSSAHKMITHPDYRNAKAGCMDSSRNIIADILPKTKIKASIICPVIKKHGNRIPLAMAEKLAFDNPQSVLTNSIILSNPKSLPTLTGRLYSYPEFSGPVFKENYCLVDDVYTTGKTLITLKRFIEDHGGNVTDIICLGSSKATGFELSKHHIKLLLAKFPDIESYFDINLLTQPMARYILRFNSLQSFHLKANENIYSFFHSAPDA